MPTPRPKLIVLKCRCGCGQWAGFTSRPRFDENGIPTQEGMYADTQRQAVRNAIRWSANPENRSE